MKTSSGSVSVRQHLQRFTIVTIVAVGLLALARLAEGEIVYTPAHIKIEANSSYNLDLTGDGVTDFVIVSTTIRGFGQFFASGAARNEVAGNGEVALALSRGAEIGSLQTFTAPAYMVWCQPVFNCRGNWLNVSNRYLGLSFEIDGEIHYGWARLNVHADHDYIGAATLTGYAYETTANMPINAGQTKDAADASALSPRPANPDALVTNPMQGVLLATVAVCAQEVPLLRKESLSHVTGK
jgi:hypothetical protein